MQQCDFSYVVYSRMRDKKTTTHIMSVLAEIQHHPNEQQT